MVKYNWEIEVFPDWMSVYLKNEKDRGSFFGQIIALGGAL